MNVQNYLEQKKIRQNAQPVYRVKCLHCFQPEFSCYCKHIRRFDPNISFVILIHPIEVRRRIATGRMAHLCLEHSFLIKGEDYSYNEQVNAIIADPARHCMMLYPGKNSMNLNHLSDDAREYTFSTAIPMQKKLTIFVIDGTWATARKMARSKNLAQLPRLSFTPDKPSNFKVRKQPGPTCYSTIEAIHQTIDLIGTSRGFNSTTREHDNLLNAFNSMVNLQLSFVTNRAV